MHRHIAALLLACHGITYSQESSSSIQYEYSMIYNTDAASLNKHFAAFGLEQGQFTYGASFKKFEIDYGKDNDGAYFNELQSIHSVKFAIGYTHEFNEKWNLLATFEPELNSNFKNTITFDDIYPTFSLAVTRKIEGDHPSYTILGISFSSLFGKPRWLSVVSYQKFISKSASFTIGLPETNFQYALSQKNSIKSSLFVDSFYSKIRSDKQDNIPNINAIEMRSYNAGLEYNYVSDNNWMATLRSGYAFSNQLDLFQENRPKTGIDFKNTIYITMGFKYNLNL